jgi:hypothetical protein
LDEKEKRAKADRLKADVEGAAAEKAERKRKLGEAKAIYDELMSKMGDKLDEITLQAATLELETDAAKKGDLEAEIQDLKDASKTFEADVTKAKDAYDALAYDDKKADEKEAEGKKNADMDKKLDDARKVMSTAKATFYGYEEQIEHIKERLKEATTKSLKAALNAAIASVKKEQKALETKYRAAQGVFNGIAKEKLVISNAAKAKEEQEAKKKGFDDVKKKVERLEKEIASDRARLTKYA